MNSGVMFFGSCTITVLETTSAWQEGEQRDCKSCLSPSVLFQVPVEFFFRVELDFSRKWHSCFHGPVLVDHHVTLPDEGVVVLRYLVSRFLEKSRRKLQRGVWTLKLQTGCKSTRNEPLRWMTQRALPRPVRNPCISNTCSGEWRLSETPPILLSARFACMAWHG